jgi:hypothetical protein
MPLRCNRFYLYAALALVAGYAWVIINITNYEKTKTSSAVPCLFKTVTGIPCPSCGSTRTVLSLIKGDFHQATEYNPVGFFLTLVLVISPLWIIFDITSGRTSLLNFYKRAENFLKRRPVTAVFLLIIMAIWVRNIIKGF